MTIDSLERNAQLVWRHAEIICEGPAEMIGALILALVNTAVQSAAPGIGPEQNLTHLKESVELAFNEVSKVWEDIK